MGRPINAKKSMLVNTTPSNLEKGGELLCLGHYYIGYNMIA